MNLEANVPHGHNRHSPRGLYKKTLNSIRGAASKWIDSGVNRRVFVQAMGMTFLAEWGDRSQMATIALAAAKDPVGVTLGGIIGHCICTGVAVVGGKMLASKVSEKHVNIAGGSLFLCFAIAGIVMGV